VVEPSSILHKRFTCRLYGIDAPEIPHRKKPGQPYGFEAKEELRSLVYRQKVKVTLTGEKTYRREVCIVKKGGMNVNLEMVKRGYAWAYRRYLKGPYASEYLEAEKVARASQLGLWEQKNPQPHESLGRWYRHEDDSEVVRYTKIKRAILRGVTATAYRLVSGCSTLKRLFVWLQPQFRDTLSSYV